MEGDAGPSVSSSVAAPKFGRLYNLFRHVSIWLAIVSAVLLIGGLVVIVLYAASTVGPHLRYLSVGLLTASAAFLTGCLTGFVFGIPRIVSSGALRLQTGGSKAPDQERSDGAQAGKSAQDSATPATDAPVAQAPAVPNFTPSTNLAEVSDWLTKLLLGAGLVQLTRLGAPLRSLINTVAGGLEPVTPPAGPTGPAVVMAASVLVAYTVLGFLCGYVVTTLWYGSRLEKLGLH